MDITTMRLVRSDGASLLIDGTEWAFETHGLAGWQNTYINLSTSANVHTDGSTLVSKRMEETDRTASAIYIGSTPLRQARDTVQSFFNYRYTYKAYVTCLGRTRWCEGELQAFDCKIKHERYTVRFTFTLLCLDPYMRDIDGNEEAFGDSVPYFGFPFVSYMRKPVTNGPNRPVGSTPSRKVFDGINTIYNGGDVPSRYKIRIEAEGELQNPKIEKDGRKIQLVTTLHAGDVALVDFEGEETTVTINGEDALSVVSRDSSLLGMEMQVGANVFTFSVTNTENRSLAKVQILFHKKYLGV